MINIKEFNDRRWKEVENAATTGECKCPDGHKISNVELSNRECSQCEKAIKKYYQIDKNRGVENAK